MIVWRESSYTPQGRRGLKGPRSEPLPSAPECSWCYTTWRLASLSLPMWTDPGGPEWACASQPSATIAKFPRGLSHKDTGLSWLLVLVLVCDPWTNRRVTLGPCWGSTSWWVCMAEGSDLYHKLEREEEQSMPQWPEDLTLLPVQESITSGACCHGAQTLNAEIDRPLENSIQTAAECQERLGLRAFSDRFFSGRHHYEQ